MSAPRAGAMAAAALAGPASGLLSDAAAPRTASAARAVVLPGLLLLRRPPAPCFQVLAAPQSPHTVVGVGLPTLRVATREMCARTRWPPTHGPPSVRWASHSTAHWTA